MLHIFENVKPFVIFTSCLLKKTLKNPFFNVKSMFSLTESIDVTSHGRVAPQWNIEIQLFFDSKLPFIASKKGNTSIIVANTIKIKRL